MAAFTTIAAAAGLAMSAAGTTKNFVDAGKARRDAKDASDKASKAFEEANKKLEINYLKGLPIQKEPYELAREAGISGAYQVLQAGREGELRGVASTAGRAQLLNQQQQNQIRMGMGQELQGLQRAAAAEESRLQGARARLNLAEATGFQGMAADARARQQALNQAGAEGLVNVGTQAMKLAPLYSAASDSTSQFDPTDASMGKLDRTFNPSNTARFLGADIPGVDLINKLPIKSPSELIFPDGVTMPAINPAPSPGLAASPLYQLSQQYDSVTGRLIQ